MKHTYWQVGEYARKYDVVYIVYGRPTLSVVTFSRLYPPPSAARTHRVGCIKVRLLHTPLVYPLPPTPGGVQKLGRGIF